MAAQFRAPLIVLLSVFSFSLPFSTFAFFEINDLGGQCNQIGIWDETQKICTLTQNLNDGVRISGSSITLDGAGFSIVDQSTFQTRGVLVPEDSDNISIKNIVIEGFSIGIYFEDGDFGRVEDSTLRNNNIGINFFRSNGSSVENVTFENSGPNLLQAGVVSSFSEGIEITSNEISGGEVGIQVDSVVGVTIDDNKISRGGLGIELIDVEEATVFKNELIRQESSAIRLERSVLRNAFYENTLQGASVAVDVFFEPEDGGGGEEEPPTVSFVDGFFKTIRDFATQSYVLLASRFAPSIAHASFYDGTAFFRNNFISNDTQVEIRNTGPIRFSLDLPEGGNYWDTYSSEQEGCFDSDINGFCDSPYEVLSTDFIDEYPRAVPFGDLPPSEPEPEPEGGSSVLFIPGFLGSRLYTNDGRKLWEPNGSDDIRDLALNSDGSSKLPVYVGEVIDEIRIDGGPKLGTVYGELMAWLESIAGDDIADWAAYPYDWRFDVSKIVSEGTLREDGQYIYLENLVEELAAGSFTKKVTIIGHSNGGLVAKTLINHLSEQGKDDLIDRVILVGVPQIGTPQGMLGLLHGKGIVPPFVALNGSARATASTLPGAYSLLPSESYFANSISTVARFEVGSSTDIYRSVFGASIDSFQEAQSFMRNNPPTRQIPTATDEETPLPLPVSLLNNATEIHETIDSWSPPSEIDVYEVAGWGNRTMTGARYFTERSYSCTLSPFSCGFQNSIDYAPITSKNGDDTVITSSALFQDEGVYFDLNELSENYNEEIRHGNLTESSKLHDYLASVMGIKDSYNEELFTADKPSGSTEDLLVGVHSPVLLSLTDEEGNRTGIYPYPSSDLFYILEEIPGSSVHFGGEGKYVYVPATGKYQISITGIGNGTFDLTFQDNDGDLLKEFLNLPVTADTNATATVENLSVSNVILDIDGDSKPDATIKKQLSRKDAFLICKKEIGLVRTIIVRLYLIGILSNLERFSTDQSRFGSFRDEIRNYIRAQIRNLPPERAAGLALCVTALENSQK